jgi:hypothetical protein
VRAVELAELARITFANACRAFRITETFE